MFRRWLVSLTLAVVLNAACSTSKGPDETPAVPETSPATNVSTNKNDYPVFPDADAGADPSVPADQGGKGFTGEGWETNTEFDLIGDPHAVKGGLFRESISDFPGTLRMGGPNWNTSTNYEIADLVYETLIELDPTTQSYIPQLATHWQISPDKLTYRFRINPNARFSDGQPVTADDVIASWKLYSDKTLNDPGLYTQFTKFETPVAESKYIVRVKAKTVDWKHLLNFGQNLQIFSASALKNVTGADYVKQFDFKYLPGTGPYIIQTADIQKGKSLKLRRRPDYWGQKARWSVGLNNFDEIQMIVVRDSNLTFEMMKKGDLDFLLVSRSKWWVQDLDFDKVKQGLIAKIKVFNNQPQSRSSFAINTVRPPFDDLRVRKALTFLLNRPLMIEKLFFNEYVPFTSYFPGTIYENPNNPKNEYNPQEAVKLLAEAGWKDRDSQGRLVKNGKPFQIEMLYDDKSSENILTVYQEDLAKVGIGLNLRLVTFETQWKLVGENRQFDLAYVGWGANAFPDPEVEWHSRLAAQKNNNNITSFKDPEADKLMEEYNVTFDLKERVKLIQQLDGILTNLYHDIFHWTAPSVRLAYWNKFGMPPGVLTRTGDQQSNLSNGPGVERLWWIDAVKARKLNQAMGDSSIKLESPPVENHYWTDYTKKMQGGSAN